jgi:phage-related protein
LKQAFFSIKWGELGTNLMNGIIDGVVNAAKNLANAVVKAAKAALDAVKSFLGIRSPSTVMRDEVGAQVGAGMAEGITKSQGLLTKAMSGVQKVTVQSATNSNFGGQVAKAAAPSGNVTVQNMYVRNDSDIKRIAKELFVLQNNLQRGGGLA